MQARLASWLWIAALREHVEAAGKAAYVTAKGDRTAGSVALIEDRCDGSAQLWMREYDLDSDKRVWSVILDDGYAAVRDAALRQRGFDPDLWVIEIEGSCLTQILPRMEPV